jgi:CHAT domain-containing protein
VENGPTYVSSEIDAVAAKFRNDQVTVVKEISSRQLLTEAPRHRIIHLSTHGYFREDNPLFSRLSTADGALFVADTLGSRIPAELIVLSACESGRALAGRSDELSGVTHGFLAAGTRWLVASRWRIHDEATHALMGLFYEAYAGAKEDDPRYALAEAQRKVRERWNHPFYWAGFSVFGV